MSHPVVGGSFFALLDRALFFPAYAGGLVRS